MLKISRELDLALLLMAELCSRKSLSLSEWTRERKLPYRFLSKIAVKLKKAGLIKSREGREGGYYLHRKIKLGEIFQAIEGNRGMVACLQGQKCAAAKFCRQRKVLMNLNRVMQRQLNKISLGDLCR